MEKELDAEMVHQQVYAIAEKVGVEPKEIFEAIYLLFLGRRSGPRAGWFLVSLDRGFVIKRLTSL